MWQALRSIYIWSSIAGGTAIMYVAALPVFLLTMPFDKKRRFGHWYATMWGRGILKLNNRWVIEVRHPERQPLDKPMVLVANHMSMGDIMMAFCLDIHFKWISKRANFLVPFMGWFMFHAGYIPLKRGNRESIEECMQRAREYLDMGVSVLFFPEGTRSEDGNVKPFKRGAFKLAIDAQVDVLPFGIAGTKDALPKGTWKYSDDYAYMKINVGHPISTRGMTEADTERLIEMSREAVIALKEELEGKVQQEAYRKAS